MLGQATLSLSLPAFKTVNQLFFNCQHKVMQLSNVKYTTLLILSLHSKILALPAAKATFSALIAATQSHAQQSCHSAPRIADRLGLFCSKEPMTLIGGLRIRQEKPCVLQRNRTAQVRPLQSCWFARKHHKKNVFLSLMPSTQ